MPDTPPVMNNQTGRQPQRPRALLPSLPNAGSETTATTLTGTVSYLISSYAAAATHAREVRGAFSSEDAITLEELEKLPYLNAVIEEDLRLCPPVPTILPRLVSRGGDDVSGVWLPGWVRIVQPLPPIPWFPL